MIEKQKRTVPRCKRCGDKVKVDQFVLSRQLCYGCIERHKKRLAGEGVKINIRAKRMKSAGSYNSQAITRMRHKQSDKCVYCSADFSIVGFHIDHILPICLGGKNQADNLQLLCPSCNCSKGGMHPELYERSIGYRRY